MINHGYSWLSCCTASPATIITGLFSQQPHEIPWCDFASHFAINPISLGFTSNQKTEECLAYHMSQHVNFIKTDQITYKVSIQQL